MNSSSAKFNTTAEFFHDECYYHTPRMLELRFWLVTIFGSIVSLISVIENLMLFFLFTRKSHREGPNFHLLLLAFFDFFVSFAYIFLMSVNIMSDFFVFPWLLSFWFQYAAVMQTISHIAMTSGTFLIIAATTERYLITTKSAKLLFVQNNRRKIAIFAIMLGVISKGSIYFEYNIIHHPNCTGQMSEWEMQFHSFAQEGALYHIIWRFWYRNIATIFAPFFILLFLNIRIVTLQSKTDSARDATRTLILVISCYILANVVNVVLTVLENTAYKETMLQNYPNAYAITVDVISLSTSAACALRLPIYLWCQAPLREEIFGIFGNWCNSNKISPRVIDEEIPMGRHSISDHSVNKDDDSYERLLAASSSQCQHCNGCIVPVDLPVANVTDNQHSPQRSLDTLNNTNCDISEDAKFGEKNGEYEKELHKIFKTGKETLL